MMQESRPTVSFDVQAALAAAFEAHKAGRFHEAAAGYRIILAVAPVEINAMQLLGLVERNNGRVVDGLLWLLRTQALAPRLDGLSHNIGNALQSAIPVLSDQVGAGAVDAACKSLSTVAAYLPDNVQALRSLGAALLIKGDEAGARRCNADALALLADPTEESGLSTTLKAIDRQRSDYGFTGTVVIPSYNAADYLPAALDSIVAAVAYARANGAGADFKVHVAVVDDCSPDDGVDVVRRWMKAHPEQSVSLLHNNQNRGAGASRNLGAAAGYGRYLWFLDADDRFLENHLLLTARVLDEKPHVGYARTGIEFDKIDETISPEWRQASEFTYPCSMAVRRECHDLIGGFPVEKPFGPAGPEDVAYSRSISSLFICAKTAEKTVFYTMRPGNILEKLFIEMMSEGIAPDAAASQPDARFIAVEILIRRRLQAHEALRGRKDWNGPPIMPDRQQRVIHF